LLLERMRTQGIVGSVLLQLSLMCNLVTVH
jgi:hypothetical protein